MPFARVGAMPQTSSNKQRNGQRKGGSNPLSRQKGITMEDLKKQTALRLAQEQQQKQTSYSSETLRDPVVQPVSEQHVTGFSPFVQPQSASFLNHGVPNAYPCQVEGTKSPHSVHPNPPYHQHNASFKPRVFNETYSLPNQMGFPVEQMDIRQLSPQNVQLVNALRQDIDPLPIFGSSSSSESPWSQVGMQKEHLQRKQKLPHGLTVSELKEMTKARLQAEAAEKAMTDRNRDYSLDSRRMSPLDFDSVPETRERAPSRDSYQSNDIMHRGPGSTSSIPSMVQVNQQPRDVTGRQPQMSPLPAVFHNSGSGSAFHQRTDAWESISVASHNSAALSENFGSESVYSSGLGSVNVQLSESDTYQNQGLLLTGQQQGIGREELSYHSSTHTSPNNGNLYYFDAAIGGTRRRAMTSSPRPISIHEDHPIVYSDELRMPSFTSPARSALQSRPSGSYSPVRGYGTEECMSLHPGLAPLGGTDLNRPRTFSATALPLRSPDAFEFNRNRANTFSGFSSVPPIEAQSSDKLTNVITQNFLRVANNELEGGATHNNAFRNGVAAPPGFFPNDVSSSSLNQTQSFSTLGSWGDAQGSRPSLFETDIDNLTDTMGSILKLSGLNSGGLARGSSNSDQYNGFR